MFRKEEMQAAARSRAPTQIEETHGLTCEERKLRRAGGRRRSRSRIADVRSGKHGRRRQYGRRAAAARPEKAGRPELGLAGMATVELDQLPHLRLPHGARRVEAVRGEEVGGGHGAEAPPERACGRQPDEGALVVAERARDVGDGTRGEDVVVPLQDVAGARG